MRQRVGWLMACEKVMGDVDLVGLVLSHADLSPRAFVGAGRVSRSWREACRGGSELLMAVARRPGYLTKTVFAGLFGLSREESDAFPHDEVARFPGHMCMYTAIAIESALPWVGGMDGWRVRLKKRAKEQASVERTFGPDWRELQWIASAPLAKRRRLLSTTSDFY